MSDQQERPERHEPLVLPPVLVRIPVGALEANCYLLGCPVTRQAVIVDPGAEPDVILDQLRSSGLDVIAVVHTHGHFDHIAATEAVLAGLPAKVPLMAHPADAYLHTREARAWGAEFGYPQPEELVMPDVPISDASTIAVGTLRVEVIETPGHTPGSVSLRCGDDLLLSGDTLFRRGIGRTDLPGGDEEAIYESILTRLYPLPVSLRVYPGHGPETTIGEERRANPFVRG